MSKKVAPECKMDDDTSTSRVKARRRLYCNETISSLDDDIQQNPNASNQYEVESLKTEQFPMQTFIRITGSQIRPQSASSAGICINEDKGNVGLQNEEGSELVHPSKTTKHNQRDGKFVKGLLSEFTRYDSPKVSEKNTNSVLEHGCTVTLPRKDEQEVPDISLDQDDENVNDREVLVIHDDFLTSSGIDSDSGSDIDWSSLTPPAPRSPSDQRVPELDDEKNMGFGQTGRKIQRSALVPADSFFGLSLSDFEFEQPSYLNSMDFQTSSFQSRSFPISDDHVVPEFSD